MSADPRTILVVDDDREIRAALRDLFEAAGWRVDAMNRARDALILMQTDLPDVVLSDVRMPGMSGLELLAEVRTRPEGRQPYVILLSAHGDIQMAVDAVHEGAYTFFEKPFDPRRLVQAATHAADQARLTQTTRRLTAQLTRLSGLDRQIIGTDPAIAALRADLLDLADVPAPILITGETGTGKDLVARSLHASGSGADRPFHAINCATFTTDRPDPRLADAAEASGTLFLDEVAACPADVQAQLLRLVEGENRDLRVISATNAGLDDRVAEGGFRADLFYRIATTRLHCPALRERGDDIALLYAHFLQEYGAAHGVSVPDLLAEDVASLYQHDWPGNVRELRATALRHALALRRGDTTVADALSSDVAADAPAATLREGVAQFERQMIARALRAHGGRMDPAAEALGIGRRTLNEKLVKLGLARDKSG